MLNGKRYNAENLFCRFTKLLYKCFFPEGVRLFACMIVCACVCLCVHVCVCVGVCACLLVYMCVSVCNYV